MIKRMHETDPHALQMFTNFVFFVEFLFQKVVVKNILISLSLLVCVCIVKFYFRPAFVHSHKICSKVRFGCYAL